MSPHIVTFFVDADDGVFWGCACVAAGGAVGVFGGVHDVVGVGAGGRAFKDEVAAHAVIASSIARGSVLSVVL